MTLPSFVASSAVDMGAGGNGTTFVIARPGTGWVSGNVAYVAIYKENTAAVTPPSGWVEIGVLTSNSSSFRAYVFRKILGGSEPSTYTWSWTGSVWREGGGMAIANADQTTPENGAIGTQANAASTTVTAPARTPTVSNTLLLVFGYTFNDETWTENTGQTLRSPGGIRAYTFATKTGPASGVSSGTNTWTTIGSFVNVGISVLVQEVQSGSAFTSSVAGSQPAASGVLTRVFQALRGLTGSQPTGTGVAARLYHALRSLTGSEPTATGAVTRSSGAFSRALAGSEPNATGALSRIYKAVRALAGAQPTATGTIARLYHAVRDLAGSQQFAQGAVTRAAGTFTRALAGAQPAATGVVTRVKQYLRALAGSQPTATGVLNVLSGLRLRDLFGDQPSATGTVSRNLATARSAAGSQPNASGIVARFLQGARDLAGAQPRSTGALVTWLTAVRALDGVQPAATGTLTRVGTFARTLGDTSP